MVEYDLRLNNFLCAGLLRVRCEVSVPRKFYVTPKSVFVELEPVCPKCFSHDVVRNGWHHCEADIINELGLDVKEGQCLCNRCGFAWSVSCEDVNLFLEEYKRVIRSVVFDLRCKNVSLGKIVAHVRDCWSRKISCEWIRQVYVEAAEMLEQDKVLETSGIFHYDEQHLSQGVRITLRDAVTKKVVFDQLFDDKKKETITIALGTALRPYNKVVLISDMDAKYPAVLKELYGSKVEIQWCVFHLYKLIIKEFKEAYGKNTPLEQTLNMYEMLDIFFNHQREISFLKRQLIKLEQRRQTLRKTTLPEEEKDKKLEAYETLLKKEFTKYRITLKKKRRRKNGQKLKTRTLKSAEQHMKKIENAIKAFLPKKLKKRMRYIKENWDKFTTFYRHEHVPPTNNTIEQYFSSTLQKTQKKRFRNKKSAQLKLNISKAINNGTKTTQPIKFFQFLQLTAKITNMFAAT